VWFSSCAAGLGVGCVCVVRLLAWVFACAVVGAPGGAQVEICVGGSATGSLHGGWGGGVVVEVVVVEGIEGGGHCDGWFGV
jgi:hypothetical protein